MTQSIFTFRSLLIAVVLGIVLLSSCKHGDVKSHESEDPTMIYLVRHAEKAKDETSDPPLTQEGIDRAQRLAEILSDKEIDFIFSSAVSWSLCFTKARLCTK